MITESGWQKKGSAHFTRNSLIYVMMNIIIDKKSRRHRMQESSERIRVSARADSGHAGMRLDQVAAALFPDYSRARLQKWIRSGDLMVDGRVAKTTYRINGNETLCLDAQAEPQGTTMPQDIPLDVIHADEDLVIITGDILLYHEIRFIRILKICVVPEQFIPALGNDHLFPGFKFKTVSKNPCKHHREGD